jgi:hypothetical protein
MPPPSDESAVLPTKTAAALSAQQTEHPLDAAPIDPAFTDDLLQALAVALPSTEQHTDEQQQRRFAAAVAALRSFDAQQPVEAMLATHAVLAHQFAMECYRRSARSSQTANLDTRLIATAAMLSRTMNSTLQMLEQRQDEPVWVGPQANDASSCR